MARSACLARIRRLLARLIMEVLSDILRSMHVRGSVYFCERLEAPWKMAFENTSSASFHVIRRGECWVSSKDVVERLGPGDLVFVEQGRDHVLASEPPGSSAGRDGTLLLCGYCNFDLDRQMPLAEVFPSLAIVREEELVQHRWLKSTLDQLSAEHLSGQPGAELVVDKLTEIVLVELIRISFGRSECSPFVQALADRQISEALKHLHDQPQHTWTLENLASQTGMSRAAFAKRFKSLVGLPMFEYLTRLRVQRATHLLRTTPLPIYEVANKVGYESDLAFTKTFKKHTGLTPTQFRKQGD